MSEMKSLFWAWARGEIGIKKKPWQVVINLQSKSESTVLKRYVKQSLIKSIKTVLRKKKVKREHFKFILNRVMEQAEALYSDRKIRAWPV